MSKFSIRWAISLSLPKMSYTGLLRTEKLLTELVYFRIFTSFEVLAAHWSVVFVQKVWLSRLFVLFLSDLSLKIDIRFFGMPLINSSWFLIVRSSVDFSWMRVSSRFSSSLLYMDWWLISSEVSLDSEIKSIVSSFSWAEVFFFLLMMLPAIPTLSA